MRLSRIDIDPRSGFCGGVIRAIGTAEHWLDEHPSHPLYSLGAIVHNEQELGRLSEKGLVTVSTPLDVPTDGSPMLIRAHGEPPKTYSAAAERGLEVLDCTCPVVLKLQKEIKAAHERMNACGGTVVIFGKIGHAEVLGLVGQTDGAAVVVQSLEMLEEDFQRGVINTAAPVELFSQTTMGPDAYEKIAEAISARADVVVHRTICSQVALRHTHMQEFAKEHDVIVFVSGKDSSNGKVLFNLCRSVNTRTFNIGSVEEINPEWFEEGDVVGVCGATSTPQWLLSRVAEAIANI